MRIIAIIFAAALLAGCATHSTTGSRPADTVTGFWSNLTSTDTGTQEVRPANPIDHATARMTGLGGVLIILGILIGVFTKFTSGWGINLAVSGFIMVTLAWAFQQWWVPWLSVAIILGYVLWRLYIHEPPDKYCTSKSHKQTDEP